MFISYWLLYVTTKIKFNSHFTSVFTVSLYDWSFKTQKVIFTIDATELFILLKGKGDIPYVYFATVIFLFYYVLTKQATNIYLCNKVYLHTFHIRVNWLPFHARCFIILHIYYFLFNSLQFTVFIFVPS